MGPGAVYFAPLDGLFRAHADLIRVAEIEPQTMWTRPRAVGALPRGSAHTLADLADLPQRKLLHGIGNPIGGTAGDDGFNAAEFRTWADRLAAPWTSEHLSILDVPDAAGRARSCGFLMPPLQTDAQVALAAANIRRRQAATGREFAVETGVNYFAPRPGEMADGAFFAAVAEAADCGILLDISNLWVNARNGRAGVAEVVRHLPRERVWEVHLSGAEWVDGTWLDAHSGAIDPEVAAMAAEIVGELPNLGAIIYEIAPDRASTFGEAAVLRQIELLHRLWERAGTSVGAAPVVVELAAGGSDVMSPAAWERVIAERMLPADVRPTSATSADDGRAFALYGRLVRSFRAGAVAELLENTMRLLLLGLGEAAVGTLLDDYVAAIGPALFPSDEALAFARFLAARPVELPGLAEVLAFEAGLVAAVADGTSVRVTLRRDIEAVLEEIRHGRVPSGPAGAPMVLEIGVAAGGFVRRVA